MTDRKSGILIMMVEDKPAGYQEVEHTADWELEVWAPDLPGLLEQAALGMYALSHTRMGNGERKRVHLSFPAGDAEQLLVSFLAELLWIGERDRLAFDQFRLEIDHETLTANLFGRPILSQSKEIKAVTYHNLVIRQGEKGLETRIVFDV